MARKGEEASNSPLLGAVQRHTRIDEFSELNENVQQQRSPKTMFVLASVIILSVFAIGFAAGSYTTRMESSQSSWTDDSIPMSRLVPVPLKTYRFVYNSTFAKAPQQGNGNMQAWDTLIPKGRGWVHHPQLSPRLSSISAFHQIHCLNNIRRTYYSLMNQSDEALNMLQFRPGHIRHCFEYIRQELMCAADSSLEPYQSSLGVVTGWEVQRKCRDYEYLYQWAEKWRAVEYEGFED